MKVVNIKLDVNLLVSEKLSKKLENKKNGLNNFILRNCFKNNKKTIKDASFSIKRDRIEADELTLREYINGSVYYQPELTEKFIEENPDFYSFMVYRTLEIAQLNHPKSKIITYKDDDIENPTFIDY